MAIVLLTLTWAPVASAADQKAEGAPPAPVPLRWQPDLAKPVHFIPNNYMGPDHGIDLASISNTMKLLWERVPNDLQAMTAFGIYTHDKSGLEKMFSLNLEACQSLGYRITFEVNRDEPGGGSANCSVEWLQEMFKKYPCLVGVNYGVTANGKGMPAEQFLKLPRVKSLIEVCGKNGAYFMFGAWNEHETTKGVLNTMLADKELVALMKQYHRNIIFFNSANIRTQVTPEEHVQNTQTLKKMLDDGLIGRMGNYDFKYEYDHDWKARKADGYRAFYFQYNPARWDFLRTFDAK